MTYTKASLVMRMLRYVVGEEIFRLALRDFYEHNALQHVTEADLRASFERVYGLDLDWFFDQWIHTTATLDYRIADAQVWQVGDDWVTRVAVERVGDIHMPVDLQVGTERARLEWSERVQVVFFRHNQRPGAAVLDPDNVLLDVNVENNRASF
jgi:hypothetical protein